MSEKRKLLFISHDASMSGAPKLLLNLADIMLEQGYLIDIILKNDGPFKAAFEKRGKTLVANSNTNSLKDRIRKKFRLLSQFSFNNIDWNLYDAIISNTITNGDILFEAKKHFSGTVISYIHELKVVSNYLTSQNKISRLVQSTDFFFVPCQAVKNHLIDFCKIGESKIEILPYYIPRLKKSPKTLKYISHFVVGGCGTVELRKGADLFVGLAKTFGEKFPEVPIKFLWKGADLNSLEYQFLAEDIVKLKLESSCVFLPSTEDMDDFYNQLDVFVLTSREDPYPLVVLEAANASVPSICFKGSGGASEFIYDNGKVVEYLNIIEMANAIKHYYDNSNEKILDGKKALTKLQNLHQNKLLIGNKVTEVLQKFG